MLRIRTLNEFYWRISWKRLFHGGNGVWINAESSMFQPKKASRVATGFGQIKPNYTGVIITALLFVVLALTFGTV